MMSRRDEAWGSAEPELDDLIGSARTALLAGDAGAASSVVSSILDAYPCDAVGLHLAGLTHALNGDYAAAAELLRAAIAMAPERVVLWSTDLGSALEAAEDWRSAAAAYERGASASPPVRRALFGYARCLLELGDATAAEEAWRQALELYPGDAAATVGLASALLVLAKFEEAESLLAAEPRAESLRVQRLRLLGECAYATGAWDAARRHLEAVLVLRPGDRSATERLICVLWEMGDLDSTLEYVRRTVEQGRASQELRSFYPYLLLFADGQTPETIRAAHEEFGRELWHGAPLPPLGPRSGRQRLRVGYLTGELTSGAAFYFLAPLFSGHDASAVDVMCYHTRPRADESTDWFRGVSTWRDCRGWHDDEIIGALRSDEIDVLVDLSGLFPNHRLGIFARRCAPVQARYPNYASTAGVAQIQYVLTDRWVCPPGLEDQYTETPVFLPGGYLAYRPPDDASELTELPARARGFVTFGLFQRTAKMRPRFFDAAAEVVTSVPNSRLLIQNPDWTMDDPHSPTRRWLAGEFARRGVHPDRIEVMGARPHAETLEAMAAADIALDTFPFQGQTTTCECLWAGVPVIARTGDVHVARVGSSILQRAGLGELAAADECGYVEAATHLARDPARLADLRAGMRQRMHDCGLVDERRLAAEIEAAYRWMWEQGNKNGREL